MRVFKFFVATGVVLAASFGAAQTSVLRVDIGEKSVRQAITQQTDREVRQFSHRMAVLTDSNRKRTWRGTSEFSMPMRVELTRGGKPLPPMVGKRFGDITLSFDSSGDRVFATDYRDLLTSVYTKAKPTLDALFGQALVGGDVKVANYDAEIGDRQAVAGGYYVPNNGSGQREIRFPVYQSREAAAINFIHCLLLAYQGTTPYGFDAYQEGLVRAVTAKVARTSGVLDGFVQASIEQVLFNTYEVGGSYDWCNQRALSGSAFIAPNLIKPPLPTGGSYGGLYLLRYRMAGSAWQKVLAEYPDFAARLNAKLAADSSIASDISKLRAAGQQVVNEVRPSDPTIEGRPYVEWTRDQHILDVRNSSGRKLLVQPTPIINGLRSSDFGVFAIEATYFSRTNSGDEQLLSGTSYPIFWSPTVTSRFTTSAQDDRMDIAGAYGSVAPNFPDNFSGQNYRVPVDIAVRDQLSRVYLPAGAIARPSNQDNPNNFYGTVAGFVGATQVRISFNGVVLGTAVVQNGAFGTLIENDNYLRGGSFLVEVIGAVNPIGTRRINKGPGDIGLDLRATPYSTLNLSLPAGVSAAGFSADPVNQDAYDQLLASDALMARYDAGVGSYALAPDMEPFRVGNGVFFRTTKAENLTLRTVPSPLPTAIALQPGWNLVSNPLGAAASTSDVRVVTGTDLEQTWDASIGTIIGADFFEFVPGAVDPNTGLPETGTYVSAGAFAPGKAYFVRCLSANGAVLLFNPVPGGNVARTNPPAVTWRAKIRAYVGKQTYFAEAALAPNDRYQSDAPPAISDGLQMQVDRQYRSIRKGNGQVFRLTFTGLKKGQIVELRFDQDIAWSKQFEIRDARRRAVTKLGRYSGRYGFKAESSTETFELFVGGVK